MSMASFHARKPKGRPTQPDAGQRRPVSERAAASGQERADVLLVRCGLAPSRAVAQRLIKVGRVACAEAIVSKASQMLPADAALRLLPSE